MHDIEPRQTDVTTVAAVFRLRGLVQGIGVRPAIARLAMRLGLSGSVANDHDGVAIRVEGEPAAIDAFADRLAASLPTAARVDACTRGDVDVVDCVGFAISESDSVGPLRVPIPRDRAVCATCLQDIRNPFDRRMGYPFTSCTACGPRYSIIDRLPYERDSTVMRGFPLCDACGNEVASPDDRRFHAQTNACGDCGPRIWITRATNGGDATGEPLAEAAQVIRSGGILAIRGMGGYQLIADATRSDAVRRLRAGKHRPSKPFAVMISDRDDPGRWCEPTPEERAVLDSPENPIVVMSARRERGLAIEIACGLDTLGLVRPTTPLHASLLDAHVGPLIVTSGNVEGEPLVVDPIEAESALHGIADAWLHHDRPIAHSIDDSVVRVIAGRSVAIRLARGLAPSPLPIAIDRPGLALGGQQKVAFAIANGTQAALGPHLGDLDSLGMRRRFSEHVAEMCTLYDSQPSFVACDQHPDCVSTRRMLERSMPTLAVTPNGVESRPAGPARFAATNGDPLRECRITVLVQHHHAHVAAGMLEHGWLDREVLGVAFDGTGYGSDGTIWGGEFLRARATGFSRIGSLRPFPLTGGDRGVREPWRAAFALLLETMSREAALSILQSRLTQSVPVERLASFVPRMARVPMTTSAGRLFDGISSLVLGLAECDFEGEPAMRLEAACDKIDRGAYEMPITDGSTFEIDWRPAVAAIVADLGRDVDVRRIAKRFHRGLARAIVEVARRFPELPLVPCGGVFQNRCLTELVVEDSEGLRLGLPGTIPPNDGGLAAGQLAIAAAVLGDRFDAAH